MSSPSQTQTPAPATTTTTTTKATPKRARKPSTPKVTYPVTDLGAQKVTYYFPTVRVSATVTLECTHKGWGHQTERQARKCLQSLLYQHTHK